MKEPLWIDERDATTLHEKLLLLHGGTPGLRDVGLLKSALARPRHHFAYSERADVLSMAASYTAGIVGNHPFIDGNKRVGFVVGILFLELNGFVFQATEESVVQAVIDMASGAMDELQYVELLRTNSVRSRKRTVPS